VNFEVYSFDRIDTALKISREVIVFNILMEVMPTLNVLREVIQHYIFSRGNPKSGYSSNAVTTKNICISYKIFSALEGLYSVETSQHPYLNDSQPLNIQKGSPLASVFPQHNF
jgi:hypothetical protein